MRWKMFFKKWIVAVVSVLFICQAGYADICRSEDCGLTCCDCDYSEGWTVYADWLHWKTDTTLPDYAISTGKNGDTDRSIELDKDSGIRLGLRVTACGCYYVGAEYTSFTTDPTETITKAGEITRIQDVLIGESSAHVPDEEIKVATGRYNLELNQVNAEVGRDWQPARCVNIQGFTGIRWANIERELSGLYVDQPDTETKLTEINSDLIVKKNEMNFYGAYLGSRVQFSPFECLGLFGDVSFGIGRAEFDRSYAHYKSSLKNATSLSVNDANIKKDLMNYTVENDEKVKNYPYAHACSWETVSALDLKGGAFFRLCNCLCAEWHFCVGYEYHNWMSLIDFFDYKGNAEDIDSHKKDLGFNGFFVRILASF